jgi:hypothetical protein
MSTINAMTNSRDHAVMTRVDDDLHNWLTTTAATERRTRANLIWVLLDEARTARTTRETGTSRNGTPQPMAGQTAIPVPGIPTTGNNP